MCEILNVHVQKVDNGMGSIPVSRFLPLDFSKGFFFMLHQINFFASLFTAELSTESDALQPDNNVADTVNAANKNLPFRNCVSE